MATLISGNQIRLDNGKIVAPEEGKWYDSRRYLNGQLLASGEYEPGKQTSAEVIAQTNPANVQYVQQQQQEYQANQIQTPVSVPLSSGANQSYVTSLQGQLDTARKALEDSLKQQQDLNNAQMEAARQKEQQTLEKVKPLTEPFRADLEKTQRESLYINQNFEENQKLVNELDQLLTEGNDLIKQQKEITGLAAVRNPRIQKTMDDVAARAGVIEAVINARNGQIAVAENMIDRSVGAITADRQDQIAYYETILNLNRQDIVSLDNESKKLAEEQLNLKKTDLTNAQAAVNMIKELMVDPNTALLMAQGGVSLNDSVETINSKLANAQYANEVKEQANKITLEGGVAVVNPSTVPASQLRSFIDSRGTVHYYRVPKDGTVSTDSDVQTWVYAVRNGLATISQVPEEIRNEVLAALQIKAGAPTFQEYLTAAQSASRISFGPAMVKELEKQYRTSYAANANNESEIQTWANAINNGQATISNVPEDIRNEVLQAL